MTAAPGTISLREFARRRGVALSAVQKAIASGRITAVERKGDRIVGIREVEATAQWDANTDPVEAARNGKLPSGELPLEAAAEPDLPAPAAAGAPVSNQAAYLEARARREQFDAKQSELDYLKAVGLVVSASEVREAMFRRYRTLRDKLLNVPDRVATILAAERDPVAVHKLLTDEIKRVLNELSDGARSAAAGGDSERAAA